MEQTTDGIVLEPTYCHGLMVSHKCFQIFDYFLNALQVFITNYWHVIAIKIFENVH